MASDKQPSMITTEMHPAMELYLFFLVGVILVAGHWGLGKSFWLVYQSGRFSYHSPAGELAWLVLAGIPTIFLSVVAALLLLSPLTILMFRHFGTFTTGYYYTPVDPSTNPESTGFSLSREERDAP